MGPPTIPVRFIGHKPALHVDGAAHACCRARHKVAIGRSALELPQPPRDRVQRCTPFVRHAGDELLLRAIRVFRQIARRFRYGKRLPCLVPRLLQLADQQNHSRGLDPK